METTLDGLRLWGHVTGARPCPPSPVQPLPRQPTSAPPAEYEAAKEAEAAAAADDETFKYAIDAFEYWCADEARVRAILVVNVDDSIQPDIVGLRSTCQICEYLCECY